jgi:S1-C subfamily serine protease
VPDESDDDWDVPIEARPRPRDYEFDVDRALSSVVAIRASVPEDAFTATTLGAERAGNAVLISEEGVVLTIGYLVTEAAEIQLETQSGVVVPGHVLGIDQASGLGLVQALEPLGIPAMALGDSRHAAPGDIAIVAGAGGRRRSVAGKVVARQEFSGSWEYLIEEAIFTMPAHPNWGGAALIGAEGTLLGVGSLQLQHQGSSGPPRALNMVVPTELLVPIYDDLKAGRPSRPPRPWLGLFAQEQQSSVVVLDVASDGPARRAGLHRGDTVRVAGGMDISNLADFYRSVWALGASGVDVPLTIERDGDVFEVTLKSADRRSFLKTPRLH